MLSSVLNSRRAIQVNIEIMRAYVRLLLTWVNGLNAAQRLNDWNGLQYYSSDKTLPRKEGAVTSFSATNLSFANGNPKFPLSKAFFSGNDRK